MYVAIATLRTPFTACQPLRGCLLGNKLSPKQPLTSVIKYVKYYLHYSIPPRHYFSKTCSLNGFTCSSSMLHLYKKSCTGFKLPAFILNRQTYCQLSGTKDELMKQVRCPVDISKNKVSVIGAGSVGMSVVVALLNKNITKDLALVDLNKNICRGEVLDLNHGSSILNNARITGGVDYKITEGSAVCIITSGARQQVGQTRLDVLQENVEIMKEIVPKLLQYSPNTILLLATNPVDVMTYVSWKISGLDHTKVIGSGTNLDSSRFRYLVAQRLGVAPTSCQAMIIGEHGNSSVAVWSGLAVGNANLRRIKPEIAKSNDPENWVEIHKKVVSAGQNVLELKGYTNWAVGLSVAEITDAILHNRKQIHPVSVLAKGYHSISDQVFLSLPAVLGKQGVTHVIKQYLTDDEKQALQQSAKFIYDAQKEIKF